MSEPGEIVRIAAKGDGVTADGRHVPLTAPGDLIAADGQIHRGPHHVEPPCRHFGRCGGCQLQHCDEATLAQFVSDRVVNAAKGQGIEPDLLVPAYLSPPSSRRRATLHAQNGGSGAQIGFREAGSHRLVNLSECHVLAPELFDAARLLRGLLDDRKGKYAAELELTLADQGVDCGIKGLIFEGLEAAEGLLDFARSNGFARLTVDEGYGPETRWEPEPVTITLSGTPVALPSGAFLQATKDAEEALVAAAVEWLRDSNTVADLFSGLGTFAFALAGSARVLAVEAAREAHRACKAAAGTSGKAVHALHRDLFRNPLQPEELNRFDAVLLDPPRAGAREQAQLLARSSVKQVVYISCNPSSWARDARTLVEGGYRVKEVRPVGQFRWSTHVEAASLFTRSAYSSS
ncbi:MAG TPA: class I SAM-dependent RNA methyltransferase [Sphingomonadaceae bacterium]|nr:class I SAM-dependent RNA methyltransferase [Sphingomonadaceae bacterium]